jgi:protein O-GlcNAc transferase
LFAGQCYGLALSELLRARALGANTPEFLLKLAATESILGAFADSAADADAVSQIPGPPEQLASAAALAAVGFEGMGELDAAIIRFRRSLELDPRSESSALQLGKLLARQNLLEEAAVILEKLVASKPASAESWAQLASVQAARRDLKRALVCWTTVKRLQPEYPMVDSMIAQAMLAQEHPDLKEVLRVLKRAESKTPDDADNFYLEGKTLVALERYGDAANAFETAVRLRPGESNLYYQLGLTYQKLGRADLAQKQFDTLKQLRTRP